MEATDGTTGNGDEEARIQRSGRHGIMVGEGFRQARHATLAQEKTSAHQYGHQQQRNAKDGIYVAYYLVDAEHRHRHVEQEYEHSPQKPRAGYAYEPLCQLFHQARRYHYERRSNAEHEHKGHDAHHYPACPAQFVAYYLRQRRTIPAYAYHARHIVVHGTAEQAAEHYPQEGSRTV